MSLMASENIAAPPPPPEFSFSLNNIQLLLAIAVTIVATVMVALPFPKSPPMCLSCRRTIPKTCRLFSSTSTSTSPKFSSDTPLPPTAPKPTPNLRSIRESADYHAQNCIDRNYPALTSAPSRIVSLHTQITNLQKSARQDRERSNALTTRLKVLAQNGEPLQESTLSEAKHLKEMLSALEATESRLGAEMRALALSLPNRTHPATPIGTEPRLLGYVNAHLEDTARACKKSHTDIGADLGLLDFTTANTVSGWGWYYLLDDLVLLEQALVNYTLSLARSGGWRLVSPPSIVYSHIASAAGFRPRDQNGEQQVYTLEASEGRIQHNLAGTAEIPLAGLGANRVFRAEGLPLKVVGAGRAYRAEAGARGVESKGLYRVHEFTKVELFAWCPPDAGQSTDTSAVAESVFDDMLKFQKGLVESLGLYARVMEMPTTDLGASASRKVDIEVYMPSRAVKDPWGEVSSLSNCTDYQARRMNTRVKMKGGREFAWTLNGTAVAVPRMLIALLEYGYEEGVGVRVPEVLRPFMGGVDIITKM